MSSVKTPVAQDTPVEKLEGIELIVLQRPYAVRICCPHCEAENDVAYNDFRTNFGSPADWNGSVVKCPNCGKKIRIDSQSWD